jgi:chemotaxis protein MotB
MTKKMLAILMIGFLALTSCVSKKKIKELEARHKSELTLANEQLGKCGESLNRTLSQLQSCEQDKKVLQNSLTLRQEQMDDLKKQMDDLRKQRDVQNSQVGNLTVLTQQANDNIKETLTQLEKKDKYIHLLQAAKTKADSMNLALAVNLKQVLKDGLDDKDVEVKVDKTVVFVNLSDKMLYQSGSANLTPKANEVLGKIAKILESRPELEMMVEGYTDNMPIRTACIDDNWDLSVKRATSVVRLLQKAYRIDPNRLIAAGRGEYNALASNDTAEGRSTNRRTRIILLPKLDQFYDLLNPNVVPK